MLRSVGRELKRNVNDQLRGVRHVIRSLSATPELPDLSSKGLPDLPEEMKKLVGQTLRAVDDVMSAVETVAAPLRGQRLAEPGFAAAADYFSAGADSVDAFTNDLYATLKLVASDVRANQLILKGRLGKIHAELATRFSIDANTERLTALLFSALVRTGPIVRTPDSVDEDLAIKQYAAVALIFGLSSSGKIARSEVTAVTPDALLISGTRLSSLIDAAGPDHNPDALAKLFESLLGHLA